jgi:cold shock protein
MSTERVVGRAQGRVKFFNSRKGFGFIKPDDGTRDVFISVNDLTRGVNLSPDQHVEYVLIESKKGPKATEISVL